MFGRLHRHSTSHTVLGFQGSSPPLASTLLHEATTTEDDDCRLLKDRSSFCIRSGSETISHKLHNEIKCLLHRYRSPSEHDQIANRNVASSSLLPSTNVINSSQNTA